MLEVRNTTQHDLSWIEQIYMTAHDYMIKTGNPNQWAPGFPFTQIILDDINRQISYVITEKGESHGVFALIEGADPTYEHIDGKWLNDQPYATIHRIASDGKVKGIFEAAVNFAKSKYENIRIDTYKDNKIMQHLITKNGFQYCGTINIVPDVAGQDTSRLAYQWKKD